MPINHEDGQYALDCWERDDEEYDADDTEFSDNVDELRKRALTLLKAGRFTYLELFRWNADHVGWDSLQVFTKADLED